MGDVLSAPGHDEEPNWPPDAEHKETVRVAGMMDGEGGVPSTAHRRMWPRVTPGARSKSPPVEACAIAKYGHGQHFARALVVFNVPA